MLLHIGGNAGVPLERLLFILSEKGMTPRTRAFVEQARREHRYNGCAGTPKAYAVVRDRGKEIVYASMIAPATLEKRWRDEIGRRYLFDTAVVSVEWE